MALSLYCGPTVIRHFTQRSPESAERICRMALGQSRQVKGMTPDDLSKILAAATDRVTLDFNSHDDIVGKPLVSRDVMQVFRNERGGWVVCIVGWKGDPIRHAIIVSGNEYLDNFNNGNWQPITRLRRAYLVDIWTLGSREHWAEELKAQETEA